jgi:hypothetical protein
VESGINLRLPVSSRFFSILNPTNLVTLQAIGEDTMATKVGESSAKVNAFRVDEDSIQIM